MSTIACDTPRSTLDEPAWRDLCKAAAAHAQRGCGLSYDHYVTLFSSAIDAQAKVEGVHRDLAPGQSLRYIRCDLLERSGGQWGYKSLDESMHPYYYT
ncbi:hypothetical protein [Hydrogenophaga intermedia]|jgi:hypothetical protein|uniref:Uncharacterized protein n=1 Tax=Hydrogenophaga intermedia TaxID=65786 RepID=A0A1L1PI14_HYDIT|nr:hypothetical protein [Pseudomonas aeruginosa]CDN89632.1 hypothetical protein BN948_04071 [Hydrogenophaga intermedia]